VLFPRANSGRRIWESVERTIPPSIDELRERFGSFDQDGVLAFWDRLAPADRQRLAAQAARLAPGLEELIQAQRAAVRALTGSGAPRKLEAVEAVSLPEHGGDSSSRCAAADRGKAILAAGRVAALVVAGGQGTRLGFPGPKGAFPVGPISDRCLFQLHAQKMAGLSRRSGCTIPWYIMTSPATDATTRELFERCSFFGLSPEDVFIFPQGMVPAFDFEGRMMLEAPDRIFESPNGHGGALTALVDSGAVSDMERRGIDTIFYFQVDNPLIRIGDPEYLGLHDEARAEMSCKVLRKVDPDVKWGVVARVNGRIGIVEYTELDDHTRNLRDVDGKLVYWAGSPAIHLLNTDFVRRVAASADSTLPYHASAKKISTIDADGNPVEPEEPNGYKLERFVFDALPAAERVCVVEARSFEEFSPIKNAEGHESPRTAQSDLVAEYRRWLSAAGLVLPPQGYLIEIDHSRIDGPEDAMAAGLGSLSDAGDLIRVTPGSQA
jgi:UDP-N-acetylglucosamine/UDP-N-acetylgalactosamine diphosphorylase